jgi:hypothetical protein
VKLRTLIGFGIGYAIGSQFGPDRIQRLLSDLVSQVSPESSRPTTDPDGQSNGTWPSTEFDMTNMGAQS